MKRKYAQVQYLKSTFLKCIYFLLQYFLYIRSFFKLGECKNHFFYTDKSSVSDPDPHKDMPHGSGSRGQEVKKP